MDETEIIKNVLYWIALVTGLSAFLLFALWVLDITFKRIMVYYKIYGEFIQFMMDRRRKKREVT